MDSNGKITNTTTPSDGGGSSGGNSGGSGGSGGSGSSGGSGGGNSEPSGDLTRVVSSFKGVPAIEAGTIGFQLKSVDEVMAELPTKVIGLANDGEVEFPVTSWVNTDNYSPNTEKSGFYRFTAILGEPNKVCTIKDGIAAVVKVQVKSELDVIEYSDGTSAEYRKFSLVNYEEAGSHLLVRLKYTGENYANVAAKISYYNDDGNLIKTDSSKAYQDKDDTSTYVFALPQSSTGQLVQYKTFKLEISAYETGYIDAKENLEIGTPSAIETVYEEDTGGKYATTFNIRNAGSAEILSGMCVVIFRKGTKALGIFALPISGIAGGETKSHEIYWGWSTPDENGNEVEKIVPDSATIDFSYAYVDSDE